MQTQEYTVQALAKIAGISVRTLHWYDEIGLLRPCRVTQAGYRMYGAHEVDLLQQILFYRALGVPLKKITALMHAPAFDRLAALKNHRTAILAQKQRLDALLSTLDKTILNEKGEYTMTDTEKFEGFKQQLVAENEQKYGAEAREKYGDAAVNASNANMMGLTQQQYESMKQLGDEINVRLENAVQAGADPKGEEGQKIVALHKNWLCCTWETYTAAAHVGVAQMYVADARFTEYYDSRVSGCAQFLCDAITAFAR